MRNNKSGIRLSDIDRIEKSMTIAAANDRDGARRTWAKAICILHDAESAVIDADSLEEVNVAVEKQKEKKECPECGGCLRARDVEAVIKRLEELKNVEVDFSDEEPELADAEDIYDEGRSQGRVEAYVKAIEVVRNGGKKE